MKYATLKESLASLVDQRALLRKVNTSLRERIIMLEYILDLRGGDPTEQELAQFAEADRQTDIELALDEIRIEKERSDAN